MPEIQKMVVRKCFIVKYDIVIKPLDYINDTVQYLYCISINDKVLLFLS